MSTLENFGGPQVHLNRRIFPQDVQKAQTFSPTQPMRAEMLHYPNKAARILSISL
jgi:hypothetical protein